jgi:hypothetical protein
VPTFATTRADSANIVARVPWRSRTSAMRPLPVTTPIRTATSWKMMSAAVEIASTHSSR